MTAHPLKQSQAHLRQSAHPRGVNAETGSERFGHTNVGFTLHTNSHVFDDQSEGAAFNLSDLVGEAAALAN